jgi:CHAT domain-containing protein/pimeloyl-ACP methyl ester carboxylesterase
VSKRPVQASAAAAPTAFGLPPGQLERALLTGESRSLLEDYFGPESYQQLRDLARDASTRSVRGGPRVLILPGIMGSTLARKGHFGIEDTLWINPAEIALGRLTELKLNGGASAYHASGVVLLAYLKIKLRLKLAGFDADFFAYDWRHSVGEAGANLARTIQQDPARQVSLVTHSMGGLVARAALGAAGKKVARLIQLGTPNYGSFAPVQVLRGIYDVVRKVAEVDLLHDAGELSNKVFNTFPGLYEMLPTPGKFKTVNLYDAATWPASGPQPMAGLLSGVAPVIDKLAGADARFFLVAGVNQDTVTGVHVEGGEFVFEVTADGDGTVPLDLAKLAGIPDTQVYYVEESHGSLCSHGRVEAAVVDLLSGGVTSALPSQRPEARRAARFVSEGEVREMAERAPGVGQLGSADYRHVLDAVAAPASREEPAAAAAAAGAGGGGGSTDAGGTGLNAQFQSLVIGRRRQRRIEITLAKGSLTDMDSRALVLGIFRNVAPSGAARAVDQRLDGIITDFTARRMFSGDVGELFTIPVGRSQLAADLVVFAGLGAFDQFNADVQQLVAENVIRMLVRSRVDEFATILIGAGSGTSPGAVMQNLLIGFGRGLRDADPHHRFRGITLCETDAARYSEMKAELFRLAGTSLFDDIEVTLDEIILPEAQAPAARALASGPEPVYAIVRQDGQSGDRLHFSASILGSGMKAAVVSAPRDVSARELDALLKKFDAAVGAGSKVQDIRPFGQQFANLMLPAEVCTVLESMKDRHLVVVHDAAASRIPWETLTVKDWSASVAGGLSRRYLADDLPISTWLEQRRVDPALKLLLVVNPLGDLDGAEEEGDRILKLAASIDAMEVTEFRQERATKPAILSALRSGKYDIVHYAGHAFFDPDAPARSGLVCAGQAVLGGNDLLGISNLPCLVFFNACEAGRVRGGLPKAAPKPAHKPASAQVAQSFGVAEALMRGGIANFMSTYWPVGDDAAKDFAGTFYKGILSGSPVGAALLEGRKAVLKLGVRDWADYVLYGSFDFVLKQPRQ